MCPKRALFTSCRIQLIPRLRNSSNINNSMRNLRTDSDSRVLDAQCSGVTTTLGGLGIISRRYAHKIPTIVKLNHNELLTYPANADQVMFGQVRQAWDLGTLGPLASELLFTLVRLTQLAKFKRYQTRSQKHIAWECSQFSGAT